MASKLVEKMARAIEGTMFAPHELPIEGELHENYLSTARAARDVMLAEMREPSGPMIDAALLVDKRWSLNMIPRVKDAWRAMLAQYEKEQAGG